VFTVQDGQQSTLTIRERQNGPSIYGAIRTDEGVYNIESCDKDGGCNVVTFTKNSFFAEQDDPNDAVKSGEGALFKRLQRDAQSDIRCGQKGVEECFYVSLDKDMLDSLARTKDSRYFKVFSSLTIRMKLDNVNGNFYVFTVQDGQQSTLTIRERQNGPSIYGAIRTDEGVYNIESCDKDGGCNVVTFTKNSFFAEQDDPNDAVKSGEGALFKRLQRDAQSDIRCGQKGVEECFYVSLDKDMLDSLATTKDSRYFKVFSSLTIRMKLDNVNGNFYVFTVQDGPQSTLTIRERQNGPSIYGAIRTDEGVYNVESCDKDGGCNVVKYTKNSFFAEQDDPNDAVNFGR